jgi:hypothetical protein
VETIMSEFENFALKNKVSCPDGCGAFGLLAKPFKDGTQHVRGCARSGCKQCRGRASKRTGGKAQRTAVKLLALPATSSIRTGHEEHLGGSLRVEVKSGAQVGPMIRAFTKAEKQSEAARAIGDTRPTVVMALLHPEGKEAIVSFRVRSDDDMRATVAALANQLGLLP